MKNYKSKKNNLKKSKTHKKKGGSRCSINIPQKIETVVTTGNCNIGKPDCFNPKPLPQLGILPTSPGLSEVAFDGRYCCGNDNAGSQNGGGNLKDGIINSKNILGNQFKNINFYVSNGRFSTEGLDQKNANKIKQILKKKKIANANITNYALGGYKLFFDNQKLHSEIEKNKSFSQIGGNGYYLSLDSCAPGGLSTIKGYDSCCPPVFSGKLSDNTNNYVYNPFQNEYHVPAIQQDIQVNSKGGKKKTKKNKKNKKNKTKGGFASLGFQTYPKYCEGKDNWSQCGINNNSVCSAGGGPTTQDQGPATDISKQYALAHEVEHNLIYNGCQTGSILFKPSSSFPIELRAEGSNRIMKSWWDKNPSQCFFFYKTPDDKPKISYTTDRQNTTLFVDQLHGVVKKDEKGNVVEPVVVTNQIQSFMLNETDGQYASVSKCRKEPRFSYLYDYKEYRIDLWTDAGKISLNLGDGNNNIKYTDLQNWLKWNCKMLEKTECPIQSRGGGSTDNEQQLIAANVMRSQYEGRRFDSKSINIGNDNLIFKNDTNIELRQDSIFWDQGKDKCFLFYTNGYGGVHLSYSNTPAGTVKFLDELKKTWENTLYNLNNNILNGIYTYKIQSYMLNDEVSKCRKKSFSVLPFREKRIDLIINGDSANNIISLNFGNDDNYHQLQKWLEKNSKPAPQRCGGKRGYNAKKKKTQKKK